MWQHLLQMNNFHSAYSIFRGLTHSWSQKLSKTWSKFRSTRQPEEKFLDKCRRIFDPVNNYLQYRNLLTECKSPVLPLIGILYKPNIPIIINLMQLPLWMKLTDWICSCTSQIKLISAIECGIGTLSVSIWSTN